MPAAYDSYDYPSYWIGRDYEHFSEFYAIRGLLKRIPKISKAIEIGGGYGRLIPAYDFRVKKILLTDPSVKLISEAKKRYFRNKKVEYLQSKVENLKSKKRAGSFDLALMIRVLHHIHDIDEAFDIISNLLKRDGYFILEFPNKSHLKAILVNIFKGNLTYPLNIFPVDIRSKKSIKKKTLPFVNYHPDYIIEKLKQHGFETIEVRSVSNIRSPLIKKLFPLNILLDLEKYLQEKLARIHFGPSFFILSRKRGN